jgi:hypothetical protein
MEEQGVQRSLRGATLVDLLDRILDKGLVVAGDIVIQLADVELLTVKIRLVVCSVDKAEEIGMDWWRHDTFLSTGAKKRGPPKEKPASAIKVKTLSETMRAKRTLQGRTKKKVHK